MHSEDKGKRLFLLSQGGKDRHDGIMLNKRKFELQSRKRFLLQCDLKNFLKCMVEDIYVIKRGCQHEKVNQNLICSGICYK